MSNLVIPEEGDQKWYFVCFYELFVTWQQFFICSRLLNKEWVSSGECEREFAIATRLNLTSYEKGLFIFEQIRMYSLITTIKDFFHFVTGTAKRPEPRVPIFIPIAFPNLDWDDDTGLLLRRTVI